MTDMTVRLYQHWCGKRTWERKSTEERKRESGTGKWRVVTNSTIKFMFSTSRNDHDK